MNANVPLDSPLARAELTEPPATMEAQVAALVERVGQITTIAEGAQKRARYAMVGAFVIVFISAAIGIGSLITNAAVHDIKRNNDAAICRSNISGAYTSIESDRDNAFVLGVLAQSAGDVQTYTTKKALVQRLATEIDALPPRQEAYAGGITVDGLKYAPCDGSVWPPPATTPR